MYRSTSAYEQSRGRSAGSRLSNERDVIQQQQQSQRRALKSSLSNRHYDSESKPRTTVKRPNTSGETLRARPSNKNHTNGSTSTTEQRTGPYVPRAKTNIGYNRRPPTSLDYSSRASPAPEQSFKPQSASVSRSKPPPKVSPRRAVTSHGTRPRPAQTQSNPSEGRKPPTARRAGSAQIKHKVDLEQPGAIGAQRGIAMERELSMEESFVSVSLPDHLNPLKLVRGTTTSHEDSLRELERSIVRLMSRAHSSQTSSSNPFSRLQLIISEFQEQLVNHRQTMQQRITRTNTIHQLDMKTEEAVEEAVLFDSAFKDLSRVLLVNKDERGLLNAMWDRMLELITMFVEHNHTLARNLESQKQDMDAERRQAMEKIEDVRSRYQYREKLLEFHINHIEGLLESHDQELRFFTTFSEQTEISESRLIETQQKRIEEFVAQFELYKDHIRKLEEKVETSEAQLASANDQIHIKENAIQMLKEDLVKVRAQMEQSMISGELHSFATMDRHNSTSSLLSNDSDDGSIFKSHAPSRWEMDRLLMLGEIKDLMDETEFLRRSVQHRRENRGKSKSNKPSLAGYLHEETESDDENESSSKEPVSSVASSSTLDRLQKRPRRTSSFVADMESKAKVSSDVTTIKEECDALERQILLSHVTKLRAAKTTGLIGTAHDHPLIWRCANQGSELQGTQIDLNVRSYRWLCKHIRGIYKERRTQVHNLQQENVSLYSGGYTAFAFPETVYRYFLKSTGQKELADKLSMHLLQSCDTLRMSRPWVNLFCSFLDEVNPMAALDAFLFMDNYFMESGVGISYLEDGESLHPQWLSLQRAVEAIETFFPRLDRTQRTEMEAALKVLAESVPKPVATLMTGLPNVLEYRLPYAKACQLFVVWFMEHIYPIKYQQLEEEFDAHCRENQTQRSITLDSMRQIVLKLHPGRGDDEVVSVFWRSVHEQTTTITTSYEENLSREINWSRFLA
eukprot:TRINITY_DN14550_c0_g1_i3.p1 TRINITY_DN14550_c0_g1~~TRINITY_DN14550_c0_g1_i3.p1  ORF type:complete len:1064 (+),score=296.09 TRINITY_DN14550_c0_g1_i3:299-3193(+)